MTKKTASKDFAWGKLVGFLRAYELAKESKMPEEFVDELRSHYKNALEEWKNIEN